MLKRYWIVTCDYCGREFRFNGSTKPTDSELRNNRIVVHGIITHLCKNCEADYSHDLALKRAGNLKQFQPGKLFERK